MASPDRQASDHLTYLRRAALAVNRLSPLALLRGAEARAPRLPRVGKAKLPDEDVVTLVQAPSLAFAAATLESISVDGRRAVVEGHWLGLTGPMGPLPLHLTEFAAYERRHARQHPFGRFLDVLAGRMLQFFYRAWSATAPAASVDRPDDDDFSLRIAQLSGAQDGIRPRSAFPASARLRHAALFASPRNPSMIADALSDLMRLPVRVVEHIERWREVEPGDRTSLGGSFAELGRGALAGARTMTADEVFRVVVEAPDMRTYRDLLPGGVRYDVLVEAIDAFAPSHLEWEVGLALASEAIRPARLGGAARLGWSSWNGRIAPDGGVRSDVRLGPNARRLA